MQKYAQMSLFYSNARSIKTRIETLYQRLKLMHDKIRMQDPLKQGLKLNEFTFPLFQGEIRMQDPLKQGLKLISACPNPLTTPDSNARSIKTRIETDAVYNIRYFYCYSNARSIKTRIETYLEFPR